MLDNYEMDKNGVIKQINKKKFIYDFNYTSKSYDNKSVPVDNMSYLRLGYLLSNLGKVPSSLLDVGYGNGKFLQKAAGVINNCFGFDVPPEYPLIDIPTVKNIYNNYYDVVCFFDSLEHFNNIYDIKEIKSNYIYISVPWCHYLSDDWFKEWKHRKENEYLWHFNLQSLINFMSDIGYKYLCHANIEDAIRLPYDKQYENILTGIFEKC
jgi:hypothetical protein